MGGEATALKLHELGYIVYGAARRVDRMRGLADAGVRVVAMDVTDDDSMRAGIEQIVAAAGSIDVLVNNAGYGYGAKPMIFTHGLLPDRAFDASMRRATGISGQHRSPQPAGA